MLFQKQYGGEDAALAGRAADRDRAALRFHDVAREREPESRALLGLAAVRKLRPWREETRATSCGG